MAKSTVKRILDTAVELFAQNGFDQTSVRDITQAANVNLAAINYHFGSRDALIQAVAERYLTPMCQLLERQLDDHDSLETELSLEDLLELLIAAMLSSVEKDRQGVSLFMRLVGQAYLSSDNNLRAFLQRRYGPLFGRFLSQMSQRVPQMSQSEFYWRCHFMIGTAVLSMARHGMLADQERLFFGSKASEPEVFHRLVSFLAAGLRAEPDMVTEQPLLDVPEAFPKQSNNGQLPEIQNQQSDQGELPPGSKG
ncbi:TetR/AcrR family transcriptional regulator [Motiliproteus sp.]|uniref:TetR/AcrR family transcriptional regulator n=1 Tax=Motiliproteus sp. TaxID=1898955 RepID=UPI003BAD1CCE